MTRRKVPFGTTAQLTTNTLQEREIAYDTTLKRFRMGDGVATAGEVVALQDDIDALESAGSDISVIATGSTTARTLANRFADTLNVLDRDLVNDGVDGLTGVATATDATFTDASAAWTSADVGKAIAIKGAGTAGAVLVTTIASINSATSIELATPAVTTVASNCLYQYGTDNTTAMNALCAHLVALTTLGARKQVVWPAGIYLYQTSPSWSVHNIRHQGVGDVRLRPIAANANGIIAGGGASGYAWWQGWFDITVEGHGNTSDAVLIESAQHHTYDRINVRGCGAKAFHIKFGVLCHFITPAVSNNQNVGSSGFFWGATPTHGMYFTRGGPSNESSGHNTITNPILEGVPYGGYEDYCVGNTWYAGALEGCTNTGFLGTANSREVSMFGVDFEANTTMDMDLSCDGGEFYGLHLEDLITIRSGASHNKFFGGDFEVITIASGATYNKFVKCGYNRYGSGAFNNSGTGTEYDLWNITAGTRITSDVVTGATAVQARAMTSSTVSLTPSSLASIGVLTGLLSGMTLANNGSDATNDIDFAAGYAADSTGAEIISCSALTKRLDASWAAGTNQGGLDTGSIADTTYHCFAIKKDSDGTGDFLFSASATAPTMPSGYTKFRRIGSILRVSSAILAFTQNGDEFLLATPRFLFGGGVSGMTDDTAVDYVLPVPLGIKVDATLTWTLIDATPAAQTFALLTAKDANDQQPSSLRHDILLPAAGAGVPTANSSRLRVRTNTSGEIRTRVRNSTADHTMHGTMFSWFDTRGRVA